MPAHNARFAVVPAGEGLAFTPVPAVCARISSSRGSRSVSIPVHVYPDGTPSFTGRAASAATTRTERSEMRKRRLNPLGGETLWTAWTSLWLAYPAHRRTRQKKRTFGVLPKPANLICYRQEIN